MRDRTAHCPLGYAPNCAAGPYCDLRSRDAMALLRKGETVLPKDRASNGASLELFERGLVRA